MPFLTNPHPDGLGFEVFLKRDSAPAGSKLQAYTQSDITPSALAPLTKPGGGVAVAPSFTITVSVNRAQSWVLKSHATDTKLLGHERVHYLIAVCVGQKLYSEIMAVSKPNIGAVQTELTRLRSEAAKLHEAIDAKYDEDTDHGATVFIQPAWASKVRGWYTSKKITF